MKSTKNQTVANLLTLLRSNPPFKSSTAIAKAYAKSYHSIDRATISRYLKENSINKVDGVYRFAPDSNEAKKEEFLKNLFKQSSLTPIPDYDVLFLSVNEKYADFITHELKEHDAFKAHALGIVPHHNSIMVFCKKGSKESIEKVILSYTD